MRDRRRLHELLRLRAECLRVPDAIIERALSRAARADPRPLRGSAALTPSSGRDMVTPLPVPASVSLPPTVPSRDGGPSASPVTVPSLDGAGAMPAPAPHGQLAAGRIIAGYRIDALLGKGGMGAVYRAHQLSMDRPIAFKVLSARLADDPSFVGRFKREARAAGRLHHINLITVHEAGEADGLVFFSMELVEGRSLKDLLKERGRLPPDEALRIAHQVLEALAYAHGRGVIHRDIKPDNIMLAAGGRVKIADLGLSRIEDPHSDEGTDLFKTSAGSFMGTPHYMAPEQGRDAHTVDARADLYALGATLYHLICGRPPFEGASPMEVMVAAQHNPLVFPEPPPPKGVRELIAKLMEKDPARRPQDATAAVAMVDRLLAPATAKTPPARRSRLAIALTWAGGVALATLLILVAVGIVRDRERTRQWEAELAAARSDAAGLHFAEALDRLKRVRPGLGDRGPRPEACDRAIAEITTDWDAQAKTRLDGSERNMRKQLQEHHYVDAQETLRTFPAAWRSPAAELRLEALQQELESATAKEAEAARNAAGQPEPPERRRQRLEEWWGRATIEPAQAARVEDGAVVFSGSGKGRLPPMHRMLPGLPMDLHLAWRGTQAQAQAEWVLRLSQDAEVVSTPTRTELRQGGRSLLLPTDVNGQPFIMLFRRIDGLVIETLGQDGRQRIPTSIPLPPRQAENELPIHWQISGNAELVMLPPMRGR